MSTEFTLLNLSTSHWNLKMLPSCEALTPGLAHLKEVPFSAGDFSPATCQSWTATSANAQSWKLRNSSPPNQSIIFLCVILYPNSVQWWTNHWKLAETSNWFLTIEPLLKTCCGFILPTARAPWFCGNSHPERPEDVAPWWCQSRPWWP